MTVLIYAVIAICHKKWWSSNLDPDIDGDIDPTTMIDAMEKNESEHVAYEDNKNVIVCFLRSWRLHVVMRELFRILLGLLDF